MLREKGKLIEKVAFLEEHKQSVQFLNEQLIQAQEQQEKKQQLLLQAQTIRHLENIELKFDGKGMEKDINGEFKALASPKTNQCPNEKAVYLEQVAALVHDVDSLQTVVTLISASRDKALAALNDQAELVSRLHGALVSTQKELNIQKKTGGYELDMSGVNQLSGSSQRVRVISNVDIVEGSNATKTHTRFIVEGHEDLVQAMSMMTTEMQSKEVQTGAYVLRCYYTHCLAALTMRLTHCPQIYAHYETDSLPSDICAL